MANGTINLVNNSTALTGVGSKFLTEVTPGDFIYIEIGDVPYTLPVDSVNSDSSITLLRKFIGPTTSGLVWVLIPRRAQNAVYSKLADQVSQALLQALTNEDNWQQLLTGEGDVTITRPDGSAYTGPSWPSILDSVPDIAAKGIIWKNPTNAGLAVGTSVIRADISNGSDLYLKIARVKMAQSVDTIGIRILGGGGYNAGSPGQACVHDIILRTSNNNPFSINPVCIANAHTNFNSAIQAVYAVRESGDIWQIWIKTGSVYMSGLTMQAVCPPNSTRTEVLEFGRLGSSATEPENAITNQTWRNVSVAWGSGGFTVDSNGFVKTASPILKLKAADSDCGDAFSSGAIYHDDIYAANAECEGVQAMKTAVGRYEITGAEGLADEGWQMEIPQDNNGNRLCFVETSYADGVLTVQVSKKAFDAGSGNFVAGEPMEVPSGRWIDIRLSMPGEGEGTAPDGAGIEIK